MKTSAPYNVLLYNRIFHTLYQVKIVSIVSIFNGGHKAQFEYTKNVLAEALKNFYDTVQLLFYALHLRFEMHFFTMSYIFRVMHFVLTTFYITMNQCTKTALNPLHIVQYEPSRLVITAFYCLCWIT